MKSAALLLSLWAGLAASNPVSKRQGAPTREQLCVDFDGDFKACELQVRSCAADLQSKGQGFTWDGIMECFRERHHGQQQGNEKGQPAFKADIRVDTNRDGVVDVQGETDVQGKDAWTETSGAIFLANIGDSGGRCKKLAEGQGPAAMMTETLSLCHDASDDVQRAPQYMAPIRTVPISGLSDSATGTVTVPDDTARAMVRIFRQVGDEGGWEIVKDTTVFSARDVAQGLVLGIDARDTRRANGWDGRMRINFTVRDGDAISKDSVMMRVAPVLLQHYLQPVTEVFMSSLPGIGPWAHAVAAMRRGVEASMRKAGIAKPVQQLPTDDPWAQDVFEPGYTSMPGPDGSSVSLRVMVEGRRNFRNAVRLIYSHLRGDGVGGLIAAPRRNPRGVDDTFQAGGNIETIPPYAHNGRNYSSGRIVMGGGEEGSGMVPRARDFFAAQEMQDPLVLDTAWLFVGHVDEVIQFLPTTATPRGWSVVAVDPELGLKLLRAAQRDGHGGVPVMSRGGEAKIHPGFHSPTIDEFLATESNLEAAEACGKRMAANIELLKRETGVTDDEIFRVPALFGEATHVASHIRGGAAKPPKTTNRMGTAPGEDEDADEGATGPEADILQWVDLHGPAAQPESTTGNDSDSDNETRDDLLSNRLLRKQQTPPPRRTTYDSWLPSLVNGVCLSPTRYLAPKPFGPVVFRGQDIFQYYAARMYERAGFTDVDFLDDWLFHTSSGDLHCATNTYRDVSAPWW